MIISSSITILLLILTWLIFKSNFSLKAPPGPIPIPFIGHLHLLVGKEPHIFLTQLCGKYGPIMSLRFGSVPVLVVSSSEIAKEIIKNHDATFAGRPPSAVGRVLNNSDIAFGNYGDRWRQLRRLCSTELFFPRMIDSFRNVRMQEIKLLLSTLRRSAADNEPADLRAGLTGLAFNHICQVLMRKSFYGRNAEDTKEATEFMHVIDRLFNLVGAFPIGDYLPVLRWLDIGGVEQGLRDVVKAVEEFTEKVIHEHEKPKNDAAPDFIDVLLKLRNRGETVLQGQTITMLLLDMLAAGSDTSSVTLEWALAELIKNPHAMKKLQEEIATIVGLHRLVEEDDIPNLPYLQAVMKEVFRLHPAGPLLVPHYNPSNSCTVQGYNIQKGTMLFINVYAISRDPSVWEDPLAFKPERMLHTKIDFRGQDFELLPFGAGRRQCPGMPMATRLIHLVLGNLVHAFNWEMPPGKELDMTEKYGLAALMANKLEAVPCERLAPEVY